MEHVIENADFDLVISSEHLEKGATKVGVTPPGNWLMVITHGHLITTDAVLGRQLWRAGDCYLLPQNEPLKCYHEVQETGILAGVFLRFNPDVLERYLPQEAQQLLAGPKRLRDTPDQAALRLAMAVLEFPANDPCRTLSIARYAYQITEQLMRELLRGQFDEISAIDGAWRDTEQTIRSIARYLMNNIAAHHTTQSLAQKFGITPRRLTAGFKSVYEMSVHEYIKSQRLQRGMSLLRNREASVSTVAYAVGYHPAHFSTEFRRTFGCSPSEVAQAS